MGNCLRKPENVDLTRTAIIVAPINYEPFEFGYVVTKSVVKPGIKNLPVL